mgnify:FL=1
MEKIKILEKELSDLNFKRDLVIEKIGAEKKKYEIPKLKEKYEGKFFVYDNGYNEKDRWNLYVRCIEVTEDGTVLADQFQTDVYGKSDFKVNDKAIGKHIFQTEITAAEYYEALADFKVKVNKLITR